MSSLQALLNPMSSGPPSPVALVGTHYSMADEPIELDLDSERDVTPESDASNPAVERVGGLMGGLHVDEGDDDRTEEDFDMDESESEAYGGDGFRSHHHHHHGQESTPPPDSMDTESDRPAMGSSPAPDDDDSEEEDMKYLHAVDHHTDEEDAYEEGEDGAATETDTPVTDREASLPPKSRRKTPALNTPEHELDEATLGSPSYITPPAQTTLVLTPSPPPDESFSKLPPDINMAKSKSKKKSAAPKKKGQAASKKRSSQDEGEGPIPDAASPPKKTRKPPIVPKPRKPTSKNSLTNSVGLPKYDSSGRELYCVCRKPDTGKWMICCDGCEDWYHGECVKVKEEDGKLIDKYYCQYCKSPTQQTTWKRMCRLPNCRNPALMDKNPPSKYCSDQHGVEYMSRYPLERTTLSRGEVAALVNGVARAAEFKRLGDRIPTPPPSCIHSYPEETRRLAEIASERTALVAHKRRVEQRGKYVALAQERKNRVLEELKNDPEMGKVTTICGYDVRLALDDLEWDEWCASDEGREVFTCGEIPGKEGVCVKKACRTHKGWTALFMDEQQHMESERLERVLALKKEERNIWERQKRRAVKDESEGRVHVDGEDEDEGEILRNPAFPSYS